MVAVVLMHASSQLISYLVYGVSCGCVLHVMQCPPCPLQLVKVARCNMWVMEETDGPSSYPLPTVHRLPKVDAQQFPASSSPPSETGMLLLISQCA